MYLDHNATAPMSTEIIEVLRAAQSELWANPHSQHAAGRRARIALETARDQVAELVGRSSKSVRFTSGATESNAWVINHHLRQGKVLSSNIEHLSVLNWASSTIDVSMNGLICLEDLKQKIESEHPSLVSVMSENNETGIIQPIAEIYEICKHYNVSFHCDATQHFGRLDTYLDADFLSLSAHKFGGPKGVGALIVSSELEPYFRGGMQERGSRAGTCNVPAIVAMGAAAADCRSMSCAQRDDFETFLMKEGAEIIGLGVDRLPNTSCALFSFPGDMLVMSLDMSGVAVSTGAACSSGSSTESHVLNAMGRSGKAVRFSWGPDDVLTEVYPVISKCIQQLSSST